MNKKLLVLTISVGEKYEAMAKLTHPTLKAYAKKIDADFKVIAETNKSCPHWEKFQIYDLLNKYDRILYIDSDIIIRKDAPNLFDIVSEKKFGAFNEAPFTDGRKDSIIQACNEYQNRLPRWNGKYYNSGLMVVSKIHKEIFKHPGLETFNFYEQGYINLAIHSSGCEVQDLDYKFNRMTCMDAVTGEERFASYFIHYAGYPNLDFVLDVIEKDLKKWKSNPKFQYQRHILIDVQGGLGDQVDAEPAIRFMKEYIYPNEDIVVKTHYPRLFTHLGLPVYQHSEFVAKVDVPYWHVVTLPGLETLQWHIVSNLMCHTVDFCSIALLKRTLPHEDRIIRLEVQDRDNKEVENLIDKEEIEDLILVHPGKHWESKTFPKKWWQDVVDGLTDKGFKVCLIGKNEETRGVWDLKGNDSVINLTNQLSLGGLIALISRAKTLVSNDSAPIHIAGAFDNNILLIPTCKHPDHILPYRDKGLEFHSDSIYKKLTLDDCSQAPTELGSTSAEFIKRDWSEYLPNTEDVVQRTISMHESY